MIRVKGRVRVRVRARARTRANYKVTIRVRVSLRVMIMLWTPKPDQESRHPCDSHMAVPRVISLPCSSPSPNPAPG